MSSFQFWVETPVHGNGGQVSATGSVTHTEDDDPSPTNVPLPPIATIMSPAIIQPVTSDAVTGSISNDATSDDEAPAAVNVDGSSSSILQPTHGAEPVPAVPAVIYSDPTTILLSHSMTMDDEQQPSHLPSNLSSNNDQLEAETDKGVPVIGMEFSSMEEARSFYEAYAGRQGFSMHWFDCLVIDCRGCNGRAMIFYFGYVGHFKMCALTKKWVALTCCHFKESWFDDQLEPLLPFQRKLLLYEDKNHLSYFCTAPIWRFGE
ncbi:hypothetical protein Droror1_Dr00021737 [Drosera rotundifolia]